VGGDTHAIIAAACGATDRPTTVLLKPDDSVQNSLSAKETWVAIAVLEEGARRDDGRGAALGEIDAQESL
jgi:hypothetical protein